MSRKAAIVSVFFLVLGAVASRSAAQPQSAAPDRPIQRSEEPAGTLRSDSRAPYVHRLTLYDHGGTVIDPEDDFAGPYSPRATCGKCHDYAAISSGWHFNTLNKAMPPGRPGEPWFLVDPETGMVLPISGRGWPGTHTSAEVGLSNWQFVLRFGHHTPGGGFGEPNAEQVRDSSQSLRWHVSGKLEIDCMFCHAADQQHDPTEAARQIQAENFRWAPTAALGLAVIRGEARKAPDDWDPMMPPDPDFPERSGPRLVWDKSRFDPDDRVLFNMARRPQNERCYFCHSIRPVGRGAPQALVTSQDVHIAAGLLCVDCHRNGLDHMIIRGYREEAAERGEPSLAAFSCEGCHLGADGAGDASISLGGRYGAPHPQHRGLPPLHFEKMTCTACHCGPWPEASAKRFQTSLAHGLGLASRERTEADLPHIIAPIFALQHDGRIAPQRMVWPSFGATAVDGEFPRVSIDLARRADGSPAAPYRWSLAHDVRPASQSLGVRGCDDCHTGQAPIYFGSISNSDAAAEPGAFVLMHQIRGPQTILTVAWPLGFAIRPAFKILSLVCAALIALVLLRCGMDGFRGAGGGRGGIMRSEGVAQGVMVVGFLTQAVTGFGAAIIAGEVGGWSLMIHMIGAPLFIIGLTATALLRAPRCRFGPATAGPTTGQKLAFWIVLLIGFVVMSSMLAAMWPVFGYAAQQTLIEVHFYAALLLVVALAAQVLVSRVAKRTVR